MSRRVTFSNSITFTVINEYDTRTAVGIESVFWPNYFVDCRGASQMGIYRRVSGSEIRKSISYESQVFWKCSKFNVDLKNAQNNSEKVFCLWHKFIWIGCIKFSLLRREYLSSAVGVLTNSLKTLHVTKSDFFCFNYL